MTGKLTKVQEGLYGGMGAIAPDVLILYSKRWTMPSLTFDLQMFVVATLIYVALAAVVACIIPYKGVRTGWKAFGTGIALPIVLSGAASFARDPVISPRGETLPGTMIDLLSLF